MLNRAISLTLCQFPHSMTSLCSMSNQSHPVSTTQLLKDAVYMICVAINDYLRFNVLIIL